MKLPPLPLPSYLLTQMYLTTKFYTEAQVHTYVLAAVEAFRAECVRVSEGIALLHQQNDTTYSAGKKAGAFECADAIKSLEIEQ